MEHPVALFTAAGSGIGAAAARKLAGEGWQVAILSPSGRGAALAAELSGLGITGSNQDPQALQHLVDSAMQRWGRIDAVVNSAGHGPKGPLLQLTDADWQSGMDFYLLNVVRIARLVTPHDAAAKAWRHRQCMHLRDLRTRGGVPDLGRVPRRSGGLCQAVCRPVRRRRPAHEQRAAGFHRQPAREERPARAHPDGPLWPEHRGGRADRLPGVGQVVPTSPARTSASTAD